MRYGDKLQEIMKDCKVVKVFNYILSFNFKPFTKYVQNNFFSQDIKKKFVHASFFCNLEFVQENLVFASEVVP